MSDELIKYLWDKNNGPFENIFRLIEYGLLINPWMRWLTLAAAAIGIAPKDFGRWMDKLFDLNPKSDLNALNPDQMAKDIMGKVEKSFDKYSMLDEDQLVKLAGPFAILKKLLANPKKSESSIAKAIEWLIDAAKKLGVFGVSAYTLKSIHKAKEKDSDRLDQPSEEKSTKETPNRIQRNLEGAIDEALSL